MNKKQDTFFTAPTQHRFFLIPNDYVTPIGDFALRDLEGHEQYVDAEAIQPFEISAEQAKPYLQADVFDSLRQAGDELRSHMEHSAHALTELLGATAEALQARRPAAGNDAVRNALAGLREILESAPTQDPTQLARLRERLKSLRLTLQAHGFKISESFDTLADRLRTMPPNSPERQAVQQQLDSLQALIERLSE